MRRDDSMKVRLVVVEDHVLALRAMLARLETRPAIEVVATVSTELTAEGLAELVDDHQPDVVLIDFSSEILGLNPFAAIAMMKDEYPDVHVLTLVRQEQGTLVHWLVSAKVAGCLLNDDEEILSLGEIVRKVSQGRTVYSQRIVERYLNLSELNLTPRERDVVVQVVNGLSNLGAARELSVSSATVRNHLSRIYEKLDVPRDGDVNPRVCLVNRMKRLGLVE